MQQHSFDLNIKKTIRLRGLDLNGLNARDIDMSLKVCKCKCHYLEREESNWRESAKILN
jgi:hypothetical protein